MIILKIIEILHSMKSFEAIQHHWVLCKLVKVDINDYLRKQNIN